MSCMSRDLRITHPSDNVPGLRIQDPASAFSTTRPFRHRYIKNSLSGLLYRRNRITSYNVCYTKLLRPKELNIPLKKLSPGVENKETNTAPPTNNHSIIDGAGMVKTI